MRAFVPIWVAVSILTATVLTASPIRAEGDARTGGRIYRQYCVQCHGEEGNGRGHRARNEALQPPPRDHTNGFYMNMQTDIRLFKVIKMGGKANNLSHIMPQWRHILSDEEILQIVAFIRTLAKDPPYREPEVRNWGKNPFTPEERGRPAATEDR